jgi:sugar phosphate isomerase/epimerase
MTSPSPVSCNRPPERPARPLTRRAFLGTVALAASAAAQARPAAAPAWQIGCYTRPWPDADYRVALDGIAAAGFAFAGLMTTKSGVLISPDTAPGEVAAMAAAAKSRGLKIASIYGGNFLVKRTVPDGVANLKRLIDHVARCECPSLLLGGTGRAELVDAYYQVVAECCDYAAAHRVGLTIKPHGGFNSTGPQCRALIQKVAHPSFQLWYDPGNIFYYSEGKLNPVDDAATVDGIVVGMSVKDYVPPKEVNVTPGQGKVDFGAVMARLHRGGFKRGPLIVECLATGDSATVTAEAGKARRFMEDIVAKLGARA